MSKSKSKSKRKEHPDTKLSVLEEIYDTLERASDIFVGRPASRDLGMLWLSDDSIDEWKVRAYDRQSDSYIEPRGYYGGPEIRQPYHKRKWRAGDLPEVKCWPIRVRDFFAAVDKILRALVSKLIGRGYPILKRWKPIKCADYVNAGDASAEAWDELRFLIQEAEAIGEGDKQIRKKRQGLTLTEERDIKAVAIFVEHTNWSIEKIAKALGIKRTTMYRLPKFKALWNAEIDRRKQNIAGGYKHEETGKVDAWER